jgi:DNA segregation ATPase FtsK/SpoIIIE, S-DNA-T family
VSYDRGPTSAMPAAKDDNQIPGKIPYIVIIIDELVDLMQTVSADVANAIARIMQMARVAASI